MKEKKTIWIVYPYGGIVGESFLEARHIRFGRMLAKNGYDVVFMTSNFSHTFKKFRSKGEEKINVCEGFDVLLIPTVSYKKNISIGRILFELKYAKNLAKKFRQEDQPDLIITAGTGLLNCFYPVWPFVKKRNIPCIYDIMDVHLFNSYMETHHKLLTPLAKMLTHYIEKKEKPFYKYVSAVSGLGLNQLNIAIQKTEKKDIPNCLVYNGIDVSEFRNKKDKTSIKIPSKKDGWIRCVYAGTLGPSYDIETIIKCAAIVEKENKNIEFLIVGAGPQSKLVEEASKNNSRIIYIGAVSPQELPAIYNMCDIGLCTYASYSTVDMPDKFYDYSAAGLAIVNSLKGEVSGHILDNKAGVQYIAEDAKDMYKAIDTLSSNLDIYKKNSYSIAYLFDINNQLDKLNKLIKKLV